MVAQGKYNNAKYWQIGFFSLNNAATNIYLALMGYISYYANSIAGFSIVLISGILTAQNVFDAVTDPMVGFLLDRTKYGLRTASGGSPPGERPACA